jgi:hypothetical protein
MNCHVCLYLVVFVEVNGEVTDYHPRVLMLYLCFMNYHPHFVVLLRWAPPISEIPESPPPPSFSKVTTPFLEMPQHINGDGNYPPERALLLAVVKRDQKAM